MRNSQEARIVTILDLTDENQRALHALIHRLHTGRWKRYRAIAMRQRMTEIQELAVTVSRRRGERSAFVVLRWTSAPLGFSWDVYTSQAKAVSAFKSMAATQPAMQNDH